MNFNFEETTMNPKTLLVTRSNSGIPSLWESEKKMEGVTRVTCIFDENGNSKEPLHVRISSNSSLIPVRDNDYLLKVFFDSDGIGVSIIRILEIDKYSNNAHTEIVIRKSSNEEFYMTNTNATNLPDDVSEKIFKVIEKIILNHKEK